LSKKGKGVGNPKTKGLRAGELATGGGGGGGGGRERKKVVQACSLVWGRGSLKPDVYRRGGGQEQ